MKKEKAVQDPDALLVNCGSLVCFNVLQPQSVQLISEKFI